ncbi:tyrosyl-DNA phosphodiesterase-like protein isoform X2 [Carex rostrata]
MTSSRVMMGTLVPLESIHATSCSLPNIPLFEGDNVIGRNDLKITDKRVSRKHISLKASANDGIEVIVEGPNPIIVSSQGQRRKICSNDKVFIKDGDIVELIPSTHLFKYMAIGNDNSFQTTQKNTNSSKREKRHSEERESSVSKRNKQILEDEALARDLQQAEDDSILEGSFEKKEALHNFRVSEEKISDTFRLMRVQGLPSWSNSNSVTIRDVIQGDVLVAILSNYMVDIDWLLSACPNLKKIPHVLVAHGESGASFDHLPKNKLGNWVFHKPPLPISYGTHHSKAMFLIYPTGIRIIVHTANLIHVDWNNKTQGLWMQDFPWKDASALTGNNRSPFENDLVDYLATLKIPELRVSLPSIGNVSINAAFFRKFDYSRAKVRLIASVPGYHNGSSLTKWGHMKLRSILESCKFSKEFSKSPLIYQFSSLGSLDEKWMNEFGSSLSAGKTDDGFPLGNGKPLVIFPTVEDVRCSLEGYAAGGAIPSPQKNVEKDFLRKYWARWKADHVGRCRAMPHIKTYTRYNGQDIAWFLLTSANLSKAAWGALQKNNTQLMIRSYELGVLFLPSMLLHESSFSCTSTSVVPTVSKSSSHVENPKAKLVSLCWNRERESNSSSEIVRLPIPYQLPPPTYTSEDIPWSWDRRYTKKDVYGQTWPNHV